MIERDRDTGSDGVLDERLYVQTDANFNVTALVDVSGNVVERFVYDPYGKATVLSASWAAQSDGYKWQYLHQGGRQDSATGLLNFRNRDYSTSLMRWTTNDPIGFAGGDTNTYRYVGNGPGNSVDPSGLEAKKSSTVVDEAPVYVAPTEEDVKAFKQMVSGAYDESDWYTTDWYNVASPKFIRELWQENGGESAWNFYKDLKDKITQLQPWQAYYPDPIAGIGDSIEKAFWAYETCYDATDGNVNMALAGMSVIVLADTLGATDFEEAISGKELVSNKELSDLERAGKIATGLIKAGTTALGLASLLKSGPNCGISPDDVGCFVRGTFVITSFGPIPIEQIKIDDKVMAYDLTSGKWAPTPVVRTFQSDYRGFKTTIQCGGESIESTSNHPFWVISGEDLNSRPWPEEKPELPDLVALTGRWIDAGSLRVGDLLLLVNGQEIAVEGVATKPYVEKVFNLEIAEVHTYAVGRSGILVHNSVGCGRNRGGESAAAADGRRAHKSYGTALGDGYNVEFGLPSGKRPDAVDIVNKVVRELKPDNAKAIQRGWKQVEEYRKELERLFGGIWTSIVDTYQTLKR